MSEAERDGNVRALLPLVKKLARRLKRLVPTFDIDDLVGDGSLGLIRAVDSFDPARGPHLEDYARRLIAGAMLNGIRRMDPVSERARRIVRDGENQRYTFGGLARRGADAAGDGAALPGLSDARSAAAHRGQPLSLDAPLPPGESVVHDWSGDPARIVQSRCESARLAALIERLPHAAASGRTHALLQRHVAAQRRASGWRSRLSVPRSCISARSPSSDAIPLLRRIELDEGQSALSAGAAANRSEAIVPAVAEAELETALLPHDHPRWVRDAVAVSQRARDMIAKLRPVVVRVIAFWDHRIRSITIGDRCVAVDPSGCYRVS